MRSWMVAACLCLLFVVTSAAQDDEASRANALYKAGKKLDALPLYEELTRDQPKEWLYFERLADCLAAKSIQGDDETEAVALRTRMREAAKRAVELGDQAEFMRMMANSDPAQPVDAAKASSPGASLFKEAEKAYGAGDFPTAIAKYAAALEADPHLYEAALFAGDSAFAQKDLPTASKWFARAIAIDPNRETAYRYWGDAVLRYGNHPMAAREKFIDAIVAEPYSRLAWQGLRQWAQAEKAVLQPPKIDRPSPPIQDAKNPKNITINVNPLATDENKNPGSSAWMMYSLVRAGFRGDQFQKEFPGEKEYRHSLKEEDAALTVVATSVKEKKIKPDKLDESLRNLLSVYEAGMLDCWILISGPDEGIARDYDAYRKAHRQLLYDYVDRFVVHGGVGPTE
jgi:tetratricopeptide (TPR) repeat protein